MTSFSVHGHILFLRKRPHECTVRNGYLFPSLVTLLGFRAFAVAHRNVIALACNLLFVSFSVLSGAGVTLCTAKPNAEFTAGFLSSALFSWFSPIIDVGQNKQLDLDDLPVQVCANVVDGCVRISF